MQFIFNVLSYTCLGSAALNAGMVYGRMDRAQETLERCALEAQTDPCPRYRVRWASEDSGVKSTDMMIIGGQVAAGASGLMYAESFGAAAAIVRRRRQQPEPKKPVAKTPRAKNKLPRS